jgi:hypothetical protein
MKSKRKACQGGGGGGLPVHARAVPARRGGGRPALAAGRRLRQRRTAAVASCSRRRAASPHCDRPCEGQGWRDHAITFFYYEDLAPIARFYEERAGLRARARPGHGAASPNRGFFGIVDGNRATFATSRAAPRC